MFSREGRAQADLRRNRRANGPPAPKRTPRPARIKLGGAGTAEPESFEPAVPVGMGPMLIDPLLTWSPARAELRTNDIESVPENPKPLVRP